MADCRYILRLGVRGDRALDLMKALMRYAFIGREESTGYVSLDDLRRDADGEVMFDLSGYHYYLPDFSESAMAKIRCRVADRIFRTVRGCLCARLKRGKAAGLATVPIARLRKPDFADAWAGELDGGGFGSFSLHECLCLIEALKGAPRGYLVKAYGEATVCAVCGAPADPMVLAMIESIRRHIYGLRERQREERLALRERHCAEVRRMDARHDAEVADAEASLRRLHDDGSDFACFA